ncbi:hypothetical protein ACJIZ3_005650 [Penstemon smallii]|uniref:Folylpolyglutamate synthase n=1 Tax=Penstemon smallii TaxID=265156 RepID=A0ABD3S5Q9_9LAMI
MLIYKSRFPELVGVSGFNFNLRECLFPCKLKWTVSCLPACTKSINLTGIEKGSEDRKLLSSQVLEQMDRNTTLENDKQNLHFPSTYDAAMEALSSLISGKKRGDKSNVNGKYNKLDRMLMYIKILGLEEHIAGLKIIHVSGTKGKGSTCTFCEAILRESGFRTGLFISPHLIDVRERFRLDGLDISKEKFLHYFWECWHKLKENVTDDLPMPPLFQFLTVLAFKIFACEKVDVAIIEVGLGGTRDSTNVIKDPVVCGVSPLGMDHMETLGDTLQQIASHKAGIFKPHVPAFTVPQSSEAMDVLQEKANDLKIPLKVVGPLDHRKLQGMTLSLSGDHQFTNAGLAVALCKSWLKSTGNWEKLFQNADYEVDLPEPFLRGLSSARLSGRAQVVHDSPSGDLIFFLDGAHSPESMEACAKWFSIAVKEGGHNDHLSIHSFSSKLQTLEQVRSSGHVQLGTNKISKQILLFNCMEVRDPQILLPTLVDTCASSGTYFSKAIFVPSISTYNKVTSASSPVPLNVPSKNLTWQFNLQRIWEKIIHGKDVHCKNFEMEIPESTPPHGFIYEDSSNCSAVVSSLPLTINWLRDYVKRNPSFRIQVLVTGSLHLVGDVLKLLRR